MRYWSIILLIGYSLKCNGQNEDKIWLSGGSVVFTSTFETDSVHNELYIDSVVGWGIYYAHGSSNICSKDGMLLCGSDGMNVYNRTHHFMDGGYKLAPEIIYQYQNGWSGYSQSSLMLPLSGSKIYLFTPTASDNQYTIWKNASNDDSTYFDFFWYHVIDMKQNDGMGKVVQSKIPLIENGYLSKPEMMACRHANGHDWWLLKGRYHSTSFHTFLVTEQGIQDYGVQNFTRYAQDYDWDLDGQCAFSPDGTMFATVIGHRGTVNLFDFDRCTGKLSNQRFINVPKLNGGDPDDTLSVEFMSTVGVAFSSNQRFLYIASRYNILQYEFGQEDSLSSWYHVANLDTTYQKFNGYSNIYEGPNRKLYIGNWGGIGGEMSVIDNPNEKGVNCGWCRKCMRFPLYYGATTPPCMPNYRLGVLKGSPCDTIGKIYSSDMVIYPNPASNIVTVSLPMDMNTEVQFILYDMVGNTVFITKKLLNSKSQTELALPLATGVYVIEAKSNGKQFKEKLLIR